MKKKTWSLLIVFGFLAITGGVLLLKKVTLLRIENMNRPRMIRLRLHPPESFSVFYIHSIYKQPVVEEFEGEKDAIVLKGVRTRSPAVMEYFGFEDMKQFHPMNERMGAIYFRWGTGDGQTLMIRHRRIPFNEIGKRGDRIQLRVESTPLLSYFLSELF